MTNDVGRSTYQWSLVRNCFDHCCRKLKRALEEQPDPAMRGGTLLGQILGVSHELLLYRWANTSKRGEIYVSLANWRTILINIYRGQGYKMQMGPSIRYIGPNLRDFFWKRPAIRYIFITKFSNREIVYEKWSSWSGDYVKVLSEVMQVHSTPNREIFEVILDHIQKFSNLDKLYTKMKLLLPWLRKSGFWGNSNSNLGSKSDRFETKISPAISSSEARVWARPLDL